MDHVDDARLLADARAGSAQAARALFRRHWHPVWRAAYAVTFNEATADDVAQETFVRAFSVLDRLELRGPLSSWLCRVAINRAIDEVRREQRFGGEPPEIPDAPSGPQAPDDPALFAAVAALPQARRVVVVLHYWLDYSAEEIARLLDVPLGTVGSRLSRALAELRATLEVEHVGQP